MKLGDKVELVLATCVSSDDPKKLGRIKVAAPGYFDTSVMAEDAIPWAYPFSTSGYQGYSTISEGAKVWLLDNKENEDEFWYIPYPEMNDDTKSVIGDDVNTDILFSRNIGGKTVQLYHNNSDGVVMKSDDTSMTLNHQGSCVIETGGSTVSVDSNTVYCGTKGGEKEPMVRGTVLKNILSTLAGDLKTLWTAASSNPYTAHLADSFESASTNINNAISELTSQTCTLSK